MSHTLSHRAQNQFHFHRAAGLTVHEAVKATNADILVTNRKSGSVDLPWSEQDNGGWFILTKTEWSTKMLMLNEEGVMTGQTNLSAAMTCQTTDRSTRVEDILKKMTGDTNYSSKFFDAVDGLTNDELNELNMKVLDRERRLAEQAESAKWYLDHIVDEQLKRYRHNKISY